MGVMRVCSRWRRANFRGEVVPDRLGLVPLLIGLLGWLLLARTQLHWLFALGYGILGFLDDQWGQQAPKGLRGHGRALLAGRPTTGVLKLIGGLILGLLIGSRLHALPFWTPAVLLTGLMVALWANFFNLLDVRPGRAGVLFLLGVLPCALGLMLQGRQLELPVLMSVTAGLLMVLPIDRAGKGMLGDTGSNLLGGVVGTALAIGLPLWMQAICTLGLLLFHLWAERHSLTDYIERHPMLRALDRLTGTR
jgi:UDP-GlcNAc:undecaprenyl-phosphate GlcNAc-1-phosphate transferase